MLNKKKRKRSKLVERTKQKKKILNRVQDDYDDYIARRDRGEIPYKAPVYFLHQIFLLAREKLLEKI